VSEGLVLVSVGLDQSLDLMSVDVDVEKKNTFLG